MRKQGEGKKQHSGETAAGGGSFFFLILISWFGTIDFYLFITVLYHFVVFLFSVGGF